MNRLAGRVYGKRYSGLVALTAVFYKTPSGNEPVRAWLTRRYGIKRSSSIKPVTT